MDTSRNPERAQDRAFDTYDHYKRFTYVLFPQQKQMYRHMAEICKGQSAFEAGCGAGVGSAIVERTCTEFTATDVSAYNIGFAKELYPWIDFRVWDAKTRPLPLHADIVFSIEMVEHVNNPRTVIDNLLSIANKEVWFSSPNGRGKPRPPDNSYHVCEYTPDEIMQMYPTVELYGWRTLTQIPVDTDADPILYRIRK